MKRDSCIYPVLTSPKPKTAKKCVGITGKNTVTKTIDADWPVSNCAESNNKPNKQTSRSLYAWTSQDFCQDGFLKSHPRKKLQTLKHEQEINSRPDGHGCLFLYVWAVTSRLTLCGLIAR